MDRWLLILSNIILLVLLFGDYPVDTYLRPEYSRPIIFCYRVVPATILREEISLF